MCRIIDSRSLLQTNKNKILYFFIHFYLAPFIGALAQKEAFEGGHAKQSNLCMRVAKGVTTSFATEREWRASPRLKPKRKFFNLVSQHTPCGFFLPSSTGASLLSSTLANPKKQNIPLTLSLYNNALARVLISTFFIHLHISTYFQESFFLQALNAKFIIKLKSHFNLKVFPLFKNIKSCCAINSLMVKAP